jgi:hypothetical protein
MITADDCESKVMINCVPMDEHSRQVKTLKKKKKNPPSFIFVATRYSINVKLDINITQYQREK